MHAHRKVEVSLLSHIFDCLLLLINNSEKRRNWPNDIFIFLLLFSIFSPENNDKNDYIWHRNDDLWYDFLSINYNRNSSIAFPESNFRRREKRTNWNYTIVWIHQSFYLLQISPRKRKMNLIICCYYCRC